MLFTHFDKFRFVPSNVHSTGYTLVVVDSVGASVYTFNSSP